MVLAIGLVVDDAIVVLENIYRHIEEGKSAPQAALIGAREIAGPVISMTLTLAAVYTPIGFLGGVTGTLFREFAFTLAGAVIISGIVAVTLSPMMCSMLLSRTSAQGWFARQIDRVFSRLADAYGRRLERSLDYRPVTALFALAIFVALAFMYVNTSKELAPEEDQGVLFALTKGPQYANLDYLNAYGDELDKAFTSIPEAELRFVVNGRYGPNQGIAGVILKPWGERPRSAQQIKPELQQKVNAVEGMQAFAFSLPPLPASIGGLPVQMVIDSTGDFASIYNAMEKIKDAARKSGLFMVTDSDLAFNQPTIEVDDRPQQGQRSRHHDGRDRRHAGAVDRRELRQPLQSRRPLLPGDPAGAAGRPADRRDVDRYYVNSASGQQVPLSNLITVKTTTAPNALTRYNQLNSATFQAVPMPGVTMGQAVDFLEKQRPRCRPGSATTTCRTRGNTCARATSWSLLSSSR